jgi:hypothetical protein
MKYVKKPVIVEAVRFTSDGGFGDDIPDWLHEAMLEGNVREYRTMSGMEFDVRTIEGIMRAKGDSYIIRGVKGELYPCRGDIFEETYQVVEQKEEPQKIVDNSDDRLQKWMDKHNLPEANTCGDDYCEF